MAEVETYDANGNFTGMVTVEDTSATSTITAEELALRDSILAAHEANGTADNGWSVFTANDVSSSIAYASFEENVAAITTAYEGNPNAPKITSFFETMAKHPEFVDGMENIFGRGVDDTMSVLHAVESMSEEDLTRFDTWMDSPENRDLIRHTNGTEAFVAMLSSSEEPTVVAERNTRMEQIRDDFKTAMGVGILDSFSSEQKIIAGRSPEEFVTAIATAVPEYAGVMDTIKSNPELMNNFHAAFAQDPSMVEGFMASLETSEADPAELESLLADPANQGRLSFILGKIAERPDDNFDYKTLEYFMSDEVPENEKAEQLMAMGYNPLAEMGAQDWMKVLTEFLRDPQAFFANLPAMLGMGPEQSAAMAPVFNRMGNYFGMVLGPISGEDTGYGGHLANGIESATDWVASGDAQEWVDDISGATDAAVRGELSFEIPATPADLGSRTVVGSGPVISGGFDRSAEGIAPEDVVVANRNYAPAPSLGYGTGPV